MKQLILVLLTAVFLSGCATVHGPGVENAELEQARAELDLKAFKYHLKVSEKINRIGYRLVKNLPDDINLASPKPFVGFFGVEPGFLANRMFNHNPAHGVYVGYILQGSPLEAALIKQGDILERINDIDIDSHKQAKDIIKSNGFNVLTMEFSRGGRMLKREIVPEKLKVNVEFLVDRKQDINALTTPISITLQYGLINFIRSEEELAVILAHELSHIARKHTDNIPIIFMAGMLANKLTKDIERDADYFGLVILKAAGYDPRVAVTLYERMAIQIPDTRKEGILYTHPGMAERSLRIRKALDENFAFTSETEI